MFISIIFIVAYLFFIVHIHSLIMKLLSAILNSPLTHFHNYTVPEHEQNDENKTEARTVLTPEQRNERMMKVKEFDFGNTRPVIARSTADDDVIGVHASRNGR